MRMLTSMRGDTLTGPVEPQASSWTFPPAHTADENGLVGAGADLEPGTLLSAYSSGLFPMPLGDTIGWWSPDPRGVLPLSYQRVGRSLRRSCRDFDIRVDHAFDQVIDACASPVRPHGWIDANIRDAYLELHRLGWAHSIETWRDGELVGGLYGVAIGAFLPVSPCFIRSLMLRRLLLWHWSTL